MAEERKPFDALSGSAQQAVEQTMEQGQKAMGDYFTWLQKTMSGSHWMGNDLTKKLMSNMEYNIASTQAFVQKLSQAKDFQDFIRLQIEFMQKQISTFADQTKGLGEAFMKMTEEGIKTPLSRE